MLIALLAAVQAQAGGIRDFLLSEPGVVFRTLPQAARAGLVANAELGKSRTTEATNRMGNTSKIDTLTTDYVAVQLSGSSSIALKMLNKSKADTVIAVIETVSTPARDSRITFYDTRHAQEQTQRVAGRHRLPAHRAAMDRSRLQHPHRHA